jgi:hypothetical protein
MAWLGARAHYFPSRRQKARSKRGSRQARELEIVEVHNQERLKSRSTCHLRAYAHERNHQWRDRNTSTLL